MAATAQESSTITYQVPRDVYIRIWWRRMMTRPRRLITMGVFTAFAVGCFIFQKFAGADGIFIIFGCMMVGIIISIPISLHRGIARVIDENTQLTDRKTVEFGPTQIISTGPNWKTEIPWSRFLGFSEDANYFYLHLSKNGTATVVPKSAFAPDQLEKFREYAMIGTAKQAY